MSKYPVVILYRYDKYNDIDEAVKNVQCTLHITSDKSFLENLFNLHYHVLVTYGPDEKEYIRDVRSIISERLCKQWIHVNYTDAKRFKESVTYCYISNATNKREINRPLFSVFTTCYKSYKTIERPYHSLKAQTERDWEWVIVDDSGDDEHFAFLRTMFKNEPRVRLYNRSGNSGSIGNVKNEAISLCRGKYILELDHDDIILPDLIRDAVTGFEKYPDVGFIYMDYCNIYENGENFSYGDFACKGFSGYYCQKTDHGWVNVMSTPQINNVTMSHLTCMPNHPRIWKRDLLLQIGNYPEMLPICDDLEVLLRTCQHTKMLKIPKLAYIQFFNSGRNNFSLIRNSEINRLGPQFIVPIWKRIMNSDAFFKSQNAWDDISGNVQIWKRPDIPPYINRLFHPDYDTQICIVGLFALNASMERIQEMYKNPRNDFLLLIPRGGREEIIQMLEKKGLTRMKFYILENASYQTMLRYFYRIYKGVDGVIIFDDVYTADMAATTLVLENRSGNVFNHHMIELPEQVLMDQYIGADSVVLELGARYGSVSCIINRKLEDPRNQVSVEPDSSIWGALERNRDKNGCAFHILKGAISKKPLKLVDRDYASHSVQVAEGSAAAFPVFSLEEVEKLYNLEFNTLVADCEGFLGKFMEENPRLYKSCSLFIFEKDYPHVCNYETIRENLREHGFTCLFSSLHEVWSKTKLKNRFVN